MNRISSACFVIAVTSLMALSAQTAAGSSAKKNDEIVLPDVKTTISGDAPVADNNAVPDFSKVLPDKKGKKVILPELPEPEPRKNPKADEVVASEKNNNSVYAEGLVGGGFPGFFVGNFSVYRSSGNDPFKVGFDYNSADGYARKELSDGFYDREVKITGQKEINTDNASYVFKGIYRSMADGLQNQYDGFYDVTKQSVSGSADAAWVIPNGFTASSTFGASWYDRFAGVTGASSAAEYTERAGVLRFDPSASFGWGAYGFYSSFSAAGTLQADTARTLSAGNAGRGKFGTELGWKNDFIHIYGNAAAVVGNDIGDNDVIVPFTAGADFSFTGPLSSRKVNLRAAGGLMSEQPAYSDLEEKYKFSVLSFFPGDTTDWYGSFSADIPVHEALSLSCDADFKSTAFGNGEWEPYYSDAGLAGGQYIYRQTDRNLFHTNSGISFRRGIMVFSGSWDAQWIYVPVLEHPNTLNVKLSLQNENSRWGADAEVKFLPDADEDQTPEFNMSGFVRLTSAVRLAVKADDVVKLLGGQTRTYAGRYIARSGSAELLIKFFF